MRRVAATLALALCLVGCRAEPPGEPVVLVTAPAEPCYAYAREVILLADPTGGLTARYIDGTPWPDEPVVWPTGYVGRRDGSAIVVYDGDGIERARTGMTTTIAMGDMSIEFRGVRATCLGVTPESGPHDPEWYLRATPDPPSGRAPDAVRGPSVGRVTLNDAD